MWEIVHCEILSSIQCSWCFTFLDYFLREGEYYYYVFNIVNKIIRSFNKINSKTHFRNYLQQQITLKTFKEIDFLISILCVPNVVITFFQNFLLAKLFLT